VGDRNVRFSKATIPLFEKTAPWTVKHPQKLLIKEKNVY